MKSLLYKYRKFFIVLIVFSAITITLFYFALKPQKILPVYNPADVNPELVDSTVQYKSKYHTIADFSFVNQNGDTITQKNYEGKIYVADFFFTTCGSICPKMTTNLADVQKAVLNNPKVMLLSHTVFPETDSIPVLKAFAFTVIVLLTEMLAEYSVEVIVGSAPFNVYRMETPDAGCDSASG